MKGAELARDAVAAALAAGATASEVAVSDQTSLEVRVRLAEVERVEESHSSGIVARAWRGRRLGIAYSADVTRSGARAAARRAAELASIAAEDEAAGPAEVADLGEFAGDLDLVDASVYTIENARDAAREAESAATSHAGITMSDGARAGGGIERTALATSHGFCGVKERSTFLVSTSVVAQGEGGERQHGWRSAYAVHRQDLGAPSATGDEAARRALRGIGWKKPPTGPVPVVLSPDVARDFAQTLAQAVSASAVYRRSTFLAGSLGAEIASKSLSLVDDATQPRRVGSRPFDGEGVRSRRNVVIDRGRLVSWLANSYSARRTSSRTTGNASRAAKGATHVAATNLVLVPGTRPPEAILAEIGEGLYVTDLFGHGVNLTTGAWSRGGSGMWISGGKLSHPVQELTIAGDLTRMLHDFREAADDLEWLGGCAAPTVRIDGLTVAAG